MDLASIPTEGLALGVAGGFVVKEILQNFIRSRFARLNDLETEILQAMHRNQEQLTTRLHEDRERAGKHFEQLWEHVKTLDKRLLLLETHHTHNHPGQIWAGNGAGQ